MHHNQQNDHTTTCRVKYAQSGTTAPDPLTVAASAAVSVASMIAVGPRTATSYIPRVTCQRLTPQQSRDHVAQVRTVQWRSWVVGRSPGAHERGPPPTAVYRTLSSAPGGGTAAAGPSANQRRSGRHPAANSQSEAESAGCAIIPISC